MGMSANCTYCRVRTPHRDGKCLVCGTPEPVNEVPDKTLEQQGQLPMFPVDQAVS